MMKIKLLSLFSGIGAFEKALDRLGVEYELEGYSEIDKYASQAYAIIHGTEEWMNLGDITKIDETKLAKDIDILTYGFPCQDISLAGNQKGLVDEHGNKTRSGLVWDATRIIKATQPKIAIAENVKNLVSKKFKNEFEAILKELEEAGYNNYWKVLNAKDHGIAQNRERVFIVSIRKDIDLGLFEWPEPEELKTRLLDYLEGSVDDKYYLSDKQVKRLQESTYQTAVRSIHDPNGIVSTLCARDYKDPKCVDLTHEADKLDDKYYLSDKMIKYISQPGTKNFKVDTRINMRVARPLTTDQNKRAGTTNYISPDLPENFDLKLIQVGQMYGTEREPNPQAGRVYDPEGISPTLDSMQGGNRMPKIIMPEKTATTLTTMEGEHRQPKIITLGNYSPSGHNASRIVDTNGIAPTVMENHGTVTAIVDSMQGGNRMPKIIIPEATKKGYAEAEEGDGVYLNRPHQKRGVVQKGLIQTIKTSGNDVGVVVKDTRNLKEKLADDLIKSGIVKGGEVINHSYTNKSKNPKSRLTLEDYIETTNGIMPTLTTRPDTLGVVVKGGAIRNRPDENGVNKPNLELRKDDASNALTTFDKDNVIAVGEYRRDEGLRTFKDDTIGTIRTIDAGGDKVVVSHPPLRIRKLTPKECWRLMGFDDEDHDKVEAAGISNSQRYKMAGNSIVVNVVAKILKNLIETVL